MGSTRRTARIVLALALALAGPASLAASPALASIAAPSLPPPPSDQSQVEQARVIESWTTSVEFAAEPSGEVAARFIETVQFSDAERMLGDGMTHTLLLEPDPEGPDPADQIGNVRATAVDDGGRELDVEVRLSDPGPDGLVLVQFEVLDDRTSLERVEYRLHYTISGAFLQVDPGLPDSEHYAALTLGPVAQSTPIGAYRATLSWGPLEPAAVDCVVVRQAGTEECVRVGEPHLPLELRAEGGLMFGEHLLLLIELDGGAPPTPEREPAPEATAPDEAGPDETGEAAPIDSASPASLEAPAWTAFAAGGGLAAMGVAALVLARRSQPNA